MTRNEWYELINPCGVISYLDLINLLGNLEYTDPQIGYFLIQRLVDNQGFSQSDWMLLAASVVYLPGSPIDATMVQNWLQGKCHFTGYELKLFLEYITFTDGSEPTYLLTEDGDFIISE